MSQNPALSELPTYHIVTALVRFRDTFLIGKRSDKKRFAPGQWEFPSGFVDKDMPLEQIMLEELDEEFLIRDGVISKRGADFTIIDAEAEWVITPFLIDVPNQVAVLHPDEHSQIAWESVQGLHNYPNLTEFLPGILKLL